MLFEILFLQSVFVGVGRGGGEGGGRVLKGGARLV